jgi:hypothetical protein
MDKISSTPDVNPDPVVPDPDPVVPANDLAAYSGTWNAVLGSENINVTGYGGPYTMEIIYGVTHIDFSNVTSSSARALVSSYFEYDAFDSSGDYAETLDSDYDNETVQVSRPSPDTLGYTFPGGSTVSIVINSATSITVTESGSFVLYGERFQYQGTYDMTKAN